jgi:hypothetical protein
MQYPVDVPFREGGGGGLGVGRVQVTSSVMNYILIMDGNRFVWLYLLFSSTLQYYVNFASLSLFMTGKQKEIRFDLLSRQILTGIHTFCTVSLSPPLTPVYGLRAVRYFPLAVCMSPWVTPPPPQPSPLNCCHMWAALLSRWNQPEFSLFSSLLLHFFTISSMGTAVKTGELVVIFRAGICMLYGSQQMCREGIRIKVVSPAILCLYIYS